MLHVLRTVYLQWRKYWMKNSVSIAVSCAPFTRILRSNPRSITDPVLDIPSLYMISNSQAVNGGATLFLTTFSLVLDPVTVPLASLICPILRISILTEQKNFKALPPGVVSGLPNMTPIFSLIWLVKMQTQLDFEIAAVNLLIAWLIIRACKPTVVSPI